MAHWSLFAGLGLCLTWLGLALAKRPIFVFILTDDQDWHMNSLEYMPLLNKYVINDNYLPVWLQDIGHNTYYSGKLWNQHSIDNYNSPHAGGFNQSDFLLDPYTYEYRNAWMTRNGAEPVNYPGEYSPDMPKYADRHTTSRRGKETRVDEKKKGKGE